MFEDLSDSIDKKKKEKARELLKYLAKTLKDLIRKMDVYSKNVTLVDMTSDLRDESFIIRDEIVRFFNLERKDENDEEEREEESEETAIQQEIAI